MSGLPAGRAKRVNPPLTAIISDESLYESTGFFFYILPSRGDENPRPGFDNGQLPVGQTTNNMSGLPAGRAKRVNPPLTAIISDESLYESTGFFFYILPSRGDENPRPGFDNGQLPVGQTTNNMSGLPAGRAKRVNPPLTAIISDESLYESTGFFLLYSPFLGG